MQSILLFLALFAKPQPKPILPIPACYPNGGCNPKAESRAPTTIPEPCPKCVPFKPHK